MEASRLAPTPKPITISGSSRTRSDCSGMRSGCSGERKYRYGSSHSPDLKSGTFERAAPTAADPKEKLPSGSVEGCFGDGSRSRIGAPEAPGECSRDVRKGLSDSRRCRISEPERRIGGPANSHRCRIPRPGSLRAGSHRCRIPRPVPGIIIIIIIIIIIFRALDRNDTILQYCYGSSRIG